MQTTVTLERIEQDAYVREVLPHSFELWNDGRTFERYVEDFRTVASSAYAKRRPFTMGLRENGKLVTSCKNYDRELRWDSSSLRATGIGAVFTPQTLRGRGYATAFLGAHLDAERDAGRDLAFLFSDIHPAYYARMGFIALPSRVVTIRSESLDGRAIGARAVEDADWSGIRRCFDALDRQRPWSLRRTPLIWNWMRARWNAPAREGTQAVHLVVRRARSVVAYAIGRRVLRSDMFVIDDFAFDGEEGRALVPALLRMAAGDLRRVGGWLPPPLARETLPRGSVRPRTESILMVAPLSQLGRAWWAQAREATLASRSDATWSADHV